MNTLRFSRRRMIRGIGAAALLPYIGRMSAFAQSAQTDYKALVCVFLAGGNDGHNTVIPLTQSEFNLYKQARGTLALPDSNGPLVQVQTKNGTPYGLNPGLTALQPYWTSSQLAVLANVGMLVQPVTRPQFLSNAVPLPTNLFSHSDQMQQMQSGIPSSSGGTGWGARMADVLNPLNGASSFPAAVSISGPALFCAGKIVQSASLLPGFNLDPSGMQLWPQAAGDARKTGLQQVLSLNSGVTLVQAANKVRQDAMNLNSLLTGNTATLTTPFPGTSIGDQLKQIAQIIKLRGTVGMSRQIFFCTLGGFDTHGSQSWQHWDLLRQLAEGLDAFYKATTELGIPDKVTSFTLSDFGRTLQPSGTGTDHGWGSHHLILGGAVQGGQLYGSFPTLGLGGPDDSGSRGALIPSTSVDQYGATLASWFGVPSDQLTSVFPNLAGFPTQNLGFLG